MTVIGYIRREKDMKSDIKTRRYMASHIKNLGVMDAGKTEPPSKILKSCKHQNRSEERKVGRGQR
jgi:hypothetical protein